MAGSSVTFAQRHCDSKSSTKAMSSKKTTSRTSVFNRLGSPTVTTTQRSDTEAALSRWCRQGSPPPTLFRQPQEVWQVFCSFLHQTALAGPRWGARLADFAPHWLSLLGNCRATGIVEDGVGSAFQQRPQLTHHCISCRTRNSRQDLQQAVDALLLKGAIERVTNMTSLGYYNRLFLVPKKTGDLRPVIDLSSLNRHMVVLHFKMEMQGSFRSAIRSQECTISIDISDANLSCSDAPGRLQVSTLRGQQASVPVHSSPF